jgi:hypothetical protein
MQVLKPVYFKAGFLSAMLQPGKSNSFFIFLFQRPLSELCTWHNTFDFLSLFIYFFSVDLSVPLLDCNLSKGTGSLTLFSLVPNQVSKRINCCQMNE